MDEPLGRQSTTLTLCRKSIGEVGHEDDYPGYARPDRCRPNLRPILRLAGLSPARSEAGTANDSLATLDGRVSGRAPGPAGPLGEPDGCYHGALEPGSNHW